MSVERMKGKITQVTQVDDENQVLSIEGGRSHYRTRVCLGCPWRVENDGSFPAGAFVASAETAYDASFHAFACHETGAEKSSICAGFLLRNSRNNVAVRMAMSRGDFDPSKLVEPPEELHASYREMAEANGVDPDDPALEECRGDDE